MKAYYFGNVDMGTAPRTLFLWLTLPENGVAAFEQHLTTVWPLWRLTFHRTVGRENAAGGVEGWEIYRYGMAGTVAPAVRQHSWEDRGERCWPAFGNVPYELPTSSRLNARDTGLPGNDAGL